MRNRLLIIAGLWTLYGLFNVVVVHYRSMFYDKPMGWLEAAHYELTFVWIWAAVTPAILSLSRRFPLGRGRTLRNTAIHLAAAFAVSIFTKLVWDFSTLPFIAPQLVPKNAADFAKSILRAIDFGTLHYLIVLIAHHALEFRRRYEDHRLRASQLEARLATAQLNALRMQLHPHFLFNTLHSISELVHADPPRAERMIVRLSDFLRLTLDNIGVPEIPLRVEIDFLRRYLEIEQMRFESHLTVHWDIDEDLLDARVPNLILQPLIENALKHGISRNPAPGAVAISCHRAGDHLLLSVSDTGPGVPIPQSRTEGIGLSNTRSRLVRLYGENHMAEFAPNPDGGFTSILRIPCNLPLHLQPEESGPSNLPAAVPGN